jgi:multiple sugar transport system ATP-binding protein
MTMADYVVVMRDGVIEQQGRPLELYDTPTSKFVAGFIGSPAMNFVPGTVAANGSDVVLELPNAPSLALGRQVEANRPVLVGLRPEHLNVVPLDQASLTLPVAVVESTGSTTYLATDTVPELTVVETGRTTVAAGDLVGVRIEPGNIHLFDRTTDLAL